MENIKNNSRIQKTFINTIFGIANKFGIAFLNFIMRTVFIYTLGIQYTGISSVFTDILTILSLSELGIGTAIATALYVPLKEENKDKIRKLMQFYKIAYRYIAFFIIAVGIILVPFLDKIVTNVPDVKENVKIIFIFYIIKTAVSYLLIYKTTLLNADQKQYMVVTRELICAVTRYIVEIIILLLTRQYMLYLIFEIFATIIQNIIVTKRAEKEYPYAFEKTNEKLSKQEKRALFKDIKGLAMYQISASVGNSIDNILVSSFIGTNIVGLLSNYSLIRKQIESLLKQFFSAVTPSIGNLVAEKNSEKQFVIFNRIFYISFCVINFCAVSMFILFNPFIELWLGNKCVLPVKIAFVIAFDTFLYILLQAIASFRTANGLFVKGQYRPLIMAILNIILSVILIRKYNIFGTILATIICRFLTQWYDPYLLFKYVFKKSFKKFYFKYLKYVLLFIVSCYLTNFVTLLVFFENKVVLFFYKIICCLIIPNILVFLATNRTMEYKYIIDVLRRKLRRGISNDVCE